MVHMLLTLTTVKCSCHLHTFAWPLVKLSANRPQFLTMAPERIQKAAVTKLQLLSFCVPFPLLVAEQQ